MMLLQRLPPRYPLRLQQPLLLPRVTSAAWASPNVACGATGLLGALRCLLLLLVAAQGPAQPHHARSQQAAQYADPAAAGGAAAPPEAAEGQQEVRAAQPRLRLLHQPQLRAAAAAVQSHSRLPVEG